MKEFAQVAPSPSDPSSFSSSRTAPTESESAEKHGIFVVAENRLLRNLLSQLVASRPSFRLLGIEAGIDKLPADKTPQAGDAVCLVFLSNFSTPEQFADQFEPLRRVSLRHRLVLLGMPADSQMFLAAVACGIAGYVLDDASAHEVVAAAEAVARGEVACPGQLRPALFRAVADRGMAAPARGSSCNGNE